MTLIQRTKFTFNLCTETYQAIGSLIQKSIFPNSRNAGKVVTVEPR